MKSRWCGSDRFRLVSADKFPVYIFEVRFFTLKIALLILASIFFKLVFVVGATCVLI